MSEPASTTYWDYLRLLPLLELQGGLEGDDAHLSEDELHFIVVHQVFELWFKLVLRELRMARGRMTAEWVSESHIPHVVRHLKRVNEIFKLSVEAFGVLETLTPQDFLAFRKKLGESSGFQSFQMREMELLLGLQPAERERHHTPPNPLGPLEAAARQSPQGERVLARLQTARQEKSLRDALLAWLTRTPIQGSSPGDPADAAVVAQFVRDYRAGLERYDANLLPAFDQFLKPEGELATVRPRAGLLFIESYRELPLLAWPNVLLDTVVELEELLVLWRTRHARMVERIIGRRPGTGGSAGVSYLDATAHYRIFHEFWAVRSVLMPRAHLPSVQRRELYELMEHLLHQPPSGTR
jgi:tryptophan 2,3-dioxygenase